MPARLYKYLFEFLFSFLIYLGVELLGHLVTLFNFLKNHQTVLSINYIMHQVFTMALPRRNHPILETRILRLRDIESRV